MVDLYSTQKRSKIMSQISGKETKPEIIVRKYLFSQGLRYRKNDKRYPGTPDIVLPKYKIAIFVNGCFWHGHNCKAGKLPETRHDFWKKKINDTKLRDEQKTGELQSTGFKVITIWNCEIHNNQKKYDRLNVLLQQITDRTNKS
jgi:DNA mismatch endonuclease, patch repair protein